jgi:hypothetical protein
MGIASIHMTLADRGVTILLFTRGMASASYSLILRQLHAVIIDLARKGNNLLKQLVTKVTQHGAADALRLRFTESLVAGISSRIGYRTMLPVAFFSQRYLVFVFLTKLITQVLLCFFTIVQVGT